MLWTLLAIVALIVVATFLLFRVKDLSEFDGNEWAVKEVAPNPAHDEVLSRIKDMGRASKGLKGKARLIALRNHLDSLGEDVEVTSEIRHNDQPRGEWVIAPGVDTRRRVLYIHGGAWAAGSPRSHRAITDRFSQLANAAVFALDYRLMPEHRFMDGIRDCRQAYTWLLAHGPDGEETADFMVVAGDSAGGSHTLSLIAWVRDNGIRQPDAAVALSPSTDLTLTAPSNRDNIRTDPLLGTGVWRALQDSFAGALVGHPGGIPDLPYQSCGFAVARQPEQPAANADPCQLHRNAAGQLYPLCSQGQG